MLKRIKTVRDLGGTHLKVTADLNKILDTLTPQQEQIAMNRFVETYNFLVHCYNKGFEKFKNRVAGNIAIVMSCYRMIDMVLVSMFKDEKPTCHIQPQGCFHCCYINVDITETEGKILLGHVQDKGIPIDWEKVERVAKLANNLDDYRKLPYADRRCTFLGADNLCTVYEVRPLLCRTHHVASLVEDCDTRNGAKQTRDYFNIDIEMIKSCLVILLEDDMHKIENLPATLMKLKDGII